MSRQSGTCKGFWRDRQTLLARSRLNSQLEFAMTRETFDAPNALVHWI